MAPKSPGSATARGAESSRGDKSARAPASKDKPTGAATARGSSGDRKGGDAKAAAGKDAKAKPEAKPLAAAAAPSAAPAKPTTPTTPGGTAKATTPTTPGTPGTPSTPATPGTAVKKKEPKGKTSDYKVMTTGAVAIVEFVGEGDEHEHEEEGEEGGHAKETKTSEEGTIGGAWTCKQWLEEVENLEGCLASALCADEEGSVLADEEALEHVRAIESKEELLERLRVGGALEALADAIWPKLEVLKAGPATASELAKQWKAEKAGLLLFGGLPSFFNGLEARIGSPDPKVLKDMMAEHCSKPDSQVEFITGNYSITTTSEVEWKFVVEPEAPIKWPVEERLMNDESKRSHMRKLLPAETLKKKMDEQNVELAKVGGDMLIWAEAVGGRLCARAEYTGPLFQKYNGILRGLDSPVPFLKNDMILMCTAKDISEAFMGEAKKWMPATGTLPYEKARKELNLYTTTIHVINSTIVKLGKRTKAKPVYRGMSGRIFPDEFWVPNEQGVMGGVELAFMSTTPDRAVAEQYSQDGFGIIVEMRQGMIDRGAEIAWLSQYPHEVEVLFAPLAALQMTGLRIDTHPLNNKHIIVCSMRVSINLTNPTIEQVIAKRRKICTDMGKGLLMEMRSALNKKGSTETEAYLALMEGLMAERPLSHDALWYNDDPCFQEAVNETLRLKREVMNVPTLETKKLEGDAVAQLLGETPSTKPKVLVLPEIVFRQFKFLKVLNLDGFGGITTLPLSMGALKDLHTLHLRECAELQEVPPAIGKLLNLSTLNMTYCKELKELPSQIGDLLALTALDLAFCRGLEKLPPELGKLAQLQNLKLQQCSTLTELPPQLGNCKELRKLSLYGCSALTQIPDSLGNLPELQEFNLRVCSGLTHLPPTFGTNLPSLTTLDLTLCKGLTSLPESIGKMQALQTLFLGNCFNIPQLPANIVNLKSLVTLNLYNCGGLTRLPENFNNLESLQVLSLQGAEKLVTLDGCGLELCPSLNTLTLWGCIVLTQMPDLTGIPKLQIDGVPEQLADWEAAQKQKRADELREGKNKPGGAAAAPKAQGNWDAVKKDAKAGSVAAAATDALTTGNAK